MLLEQSRFIFKVFSVPEGVGDVLDYRNYYGNDSSEEICDDGCLHKDNSKWHMRSRDAVYTHKLPGTLGGLVGADTAILPFLKVQHVLARTGNTTVVAF